MQPDPHALSLAEVASHCAQETDRFFRRVANDTRFCYELLRRALALRDNRAFEAVVTQYLGLVLGWVRRVPALPATGEEAGFFANRAFEKLWVAVTPARFHRFPDLKSLLRYLQMCAYSAVTDHARAAERWQALQGDDDPDAETRGPSVTDPGLSRAEAAELWEAVAARLNGDQERLVLHGCFALGLKPAELCRQYPEAFASVREAYRVKANLLERLRRDADLRELLGAYA